MTDQIDTAPAAQKDSNPWAVSVRLKHYNRDRTRFQIAHDMRRGRQPDYVDGDRSHLNSVKAGPEADAYLRAMLERRQLTEPKRKAMLDRVAVMTGGIVTFGHLAQVEVLKLSVERQNAMYREIAGALAERLGNEVTAGAVHRDEEAPHAHFQMPARRAGDGRLMSEVLKPALTSELQDLAASVARRYAPSIERGTPKAKTGARNKTVRGLHRSQAVDLAERREKIAALDAAIAAKTEELEETEAKIAKNERLAARALEKAEGEGARAEKAAENADRYEARARKSRAIMDDLRSEITDLVLFRDRQLDDAEAHAQQAEHRIKQTHHRIVALKREEEAIQTRLDTKTTEARSEVERIEARSAKAWTELEEVEDGVTATRADLRTVERAVAQKTRIESLQARKRDLEAKLQRSQPA